MKWEKVVAGTLMLNLLAFAPVNAAAATANMAAASPDQLPQTLQDRVNDLKDALPALEKLQYQQGGAEVLNDGQNTFWRIFLASGATGKKLTATATIVFEQKTGDVVQYNYNNLSGEPPAPPTPAVAMKAATAFSGALLTGSYHLANAVLSGETEIGKANLLGVKLYQKVNGTPLLNSWAAIWVDREGTVVSYRKNEIKLPKENTFPNRYKAMTPTAAKEAFAKELAIVPAVKNNEYTYKIMYKNSIDAISGAAVTADPQQFRFIGIQNVASEARQLTVHSTAEALALLKTSFGFEPGSLSATVSVEQAGDETIKQYTWGPAVTADVQWAEVRTVAGTGLVKSVALRRHQASAPKTESTGSADLALQSAIGFAKQYLPVDVAAVSLMERRTSGTEAEFYLQPVSKDGVLYEDSGFFRVIANPYTGKVSLFEYVPMGMPTAASPESKNAVPMETAKQAYLNQLQLDLYYALAPDDMAAPRLVYLPAAQTQSTYYHPAAKTITTEPDDLQFR